MSATTPDSSRQGRKPPRVVRVYPPEPPPVAPPTSPAPSWVLLAGFGCLSVVSAVVVAFAGAMFARFALGPA